MTRSELREVSVSVKEMEGKAIEYRFYDAFPEKFVRKDGTEGRAIALYIGGTDGVIYRATGKAFIKAFVDATPANKVRVTTGTTKDGKYQFLTCEPYTEAGVLTPDDF